MLFSPLKQSLSRLEFLFDPFICVYLTLFCVIKVYLVSSFSFPFFFDLPLNILCVGSLDINMISFYGIFGSRVIGMELELTQTTGTEMTVL